MESYNRDFLHSPPVKTVRFGGTVVDTLAKHKQVSSNVTSACFLPDVKTSWGYFKCCSRRLKGNSGDYELLKHQLADPDIKVHLRVIDFDVSRGKSSNIIRSGSYCCSAVSSLL